MKLSNKVLLGFFGFIFVYLTAAFAELRLTGTSRVFDDRNSIAETVNLPGLAYVVLNGIDGNVKIAASDQPRLEVRSRAGGVLKKMKYSVSGDTLVLSDIKSNDREAIRIHVFVPRTNFLGITTNTSVAGLEGLDQALLRISQNDGRVWMSDCSISKVEIDALGGSSLDIHSSSDMDTLSATIDRSRVRIYAPVGFVQGSMKNESFLHFSEIREIQLKKDKSSRLNVN